MISETLISSAAITGGSTAITLGTGGILLIVVASIITVTIIGSMFYSSFTRSRN